MAHISIKYFTAHKKCGNNEGTYMYLYVCITDVDFHNRFYHLKVKSYSLVHFNAAVDFVVEGAGHEGIWFHLTLGIVHGCKKNDERLEKVMRHEYREGYIGFYV